MTITLNLKPEVEAGLLAQARGMTLEDYLLSLVEEAAVAQTQKPETPRGNPAWSGRMACSFTGPETPCPPMWLTTLFGAAAKNALSKSLASVLEAVFR